MNSLETVTLLALIINTIALIIVIYQTYVAKKTLILTKGSIDNAKIQRQLEILPKFSWVITTQTQLEFWRNDLQERKAKLQEGIEKKNSELIKNASNTMIKSSKDLALSRLFYDEMPSWLREVWMSGAQYYYNAIAPLPYFCIDKELNYGNAEDWLNERSENSLRAIFELLEYLKDMIPPVILNTPASLSDEDFLRD